MKKFPGMNPYLEHRRHWTSFHHLLADEVMAQLNAQFAKRYYADLEVTTIIGDVTIGRTGHIYPDVAVLENTPLGVATTTNPVRAPMERVALPAERTNLRSVLMYTTDDSELVTIIELLSPANKQGRGLREYQEKRRKILQSSIHLVEIDLLRGGQRPGWELKEPEIDTDYLCLVNRAGWQTEPRVSQIWPIALNEPLPILPIPLLSPDPDVPLDLNRALANLSRRAAYNRRIDYNEPLPPPVLRPMMQTWLEQF